MSTEAKDATACPRCKQPPGENCRMPSGRQAYIHIERTEAFRKRSDFDAPRYTGKLATVGVLGLPKPNP